MIAFLRGNFVHKTPAQVIVETGGIGYLVRISLHTYSQIQDLPSGTLLTSLMVRTENQSVSGFDLYGFAEEQERELFEKLYSVSGISAATARVILSSLRPQEVVQAILSENEAAIQRIKGIGPKLAKRMILELKDKIGKSSAEEVLLPTAGHSVRLEALTALQALGFNKQAVEKELSRLMPQKSDWTIEGLIKEALRHL